MHSAVFFLLFPLPKKITTCKFSSTKISMHFITSTQITLFPRAPSNLIEGYQFAYNCASHGVGLPQNEKKRTPKGSIFCIHIRKASPGTIPKTTLNQIPPVFLIHVTTNPSVLLSNSTHDASSPSCLSQLSSHHEEPRWHMWKIHFNLPTSLSARNWVCDGKNVSFLPKIRTNVEKSMKFSPQNVVTDHFRHFFFRTKMLKICKKRVFLCVFFFISFKTLYSLTKERLPFPLSGTLN